MSLILQTRNLTKKFGDFTANNNINLSVEKGEIKAIIGENGAGKSTLMNMLYGQIQPTSGTIYLNTEKVNFDSPKDAIKLGIGMVHQHFMLVPSFKVYENILLGTEILDDKTKLVIDRDKEIEVCKELVEKYGYDLDVKKTTKDLSVGEQQKIEILKMLYRDVDVLILDEPTSVLTPQETKMLLDSLKELKKQGKTIIIITHKLKEVMYVSDSITIIKRGEVIANVKTSETNEEELAEMMVGRQVLLNVRNDHKTKSKDEFIYNVHNISTTDSSGKEVVDKVSFSLRKGEIYGIAGVDGNGQSELMKMITGMMESTKGVIYYKGKEVTNFWADDLRVLGVAIIPEDRYEEGLCVDMTIKDNSIVGKLNPKLDRNEKIAFNPKKSSAFVKDLIEEYDIRISDIKGNVSQLSGGNAQKLIIARELEGEKELLIASQPTRGVDIGSIEFIHKKILEFRDNGGSVILISSELPEIMSLSDRIGVMYKGKIIGEVDGATTNERELGLLMSGVINTSEVVYG